MFYIMGSLSDLSFLGIVGLVVPGIGLAIAMFILGAHYFLGLIIIAFLWRKAQGWLANGILLISWILPLPLLTTGIVLAIIASNKIAALIIETVAIQAVAIATGGAGEALEAGAVATEGAEVAATAAEGAEAAREPDRGIERVDGTERVAGLAGLDGADGRPPDRPSTRPVRLDDGRVLTPMPVR